MSWVVYIIHTDRDTYYTGITTDIARRWREHSGTNKGIKKGAKYFNGHKPVALVYLENGHTRSTASKREAQIKALPRSQKLSLVKQSEIDKKRLAELISN